MLVPNLIFDTSWRMAYITSSASITSHGMPNFRISSPLRCIVAHDKRKQLCVCALISWHKRQCFIYMTQTPTLSIECISHFTSDVSQAVKLTMFITIISTESHAYDMRERRHHIWPCHNTTISYPYKPDTPRVSTHVPLGLIQFLASYCAAFRFWPARINAIFSAYI